MAAVTRMSISRTSGTQSARIESLRTKVKCSSIEENLKNEIIKELDYIDMLNERQFDETQQVLSDI